MLLDLKYFDKILLVIFTTKKGLILRLQHAGFEMAILKKKTI